MVVVGTFAKSFTKDHIESHVCHIRFAIWSTAVHVGILNSPWIVFCFIQFYCAISVLLLW